jgi:UDP-glucose 4-epimerase
VGKYLVTGGCGFIGSHLVDALCDCGQSVRILDDLSAGNIAFKPPSVEFIEGDVAEPSIVAEAMQGVDGCFHLAAVASVERGNSDWLETHHTNLTGTVAVLDAARRNNPKDPIPVVFTSSAAVYGDNRDIPLCEDATLRPLCAYGADKLGCELHSFVASHIHRIPACGLRLFNVYGPRQSPNSPYSGVISIFCERLKAHRQITVYGDGHQRRDFVYVADVVRALQSAMDNCSVACEILNICTGTATTIREVAKLIGDILGITPDITFGPARDGEVRTSVGDPSRAHRVLSFIASTELMAGLKTYLNEI